jgi:competence protein ComEC
MNGQGTACYHFAIAALAYLADRDADVLAVLVELAALVAAFFYLLLSGTEVATQRSFIMTAIVMVDRSALTLRNLALAALGVMLLAPEAVVHPSFPDVACS